MLQLDAKAVLSNGHSKKYTKSTIQRDITPPAGISKCGLNIEGEGSVLIFFNRLKDHGNLHVFATFYDYE